MKPSRYHANPNTNLLLRFVLVCLLISMCYMEGVAQNAAFDMNQRLGRGINMGNAFEAPTETAWGNPWQPEYFEMIAELGFQHVRLPVQWETADRSMTEAPYTIDPAFLQRIKLAVDEALKNDLIIIINMHHHYLLFENPLDERERFLAQWQQIADYFQDYPETLLFEVLNEPHGNLSPPMWNEFFADAVREIRVNNPDRIVLMGTADFGGLSGVPFLELPEDEHIIVSVHYYNPFRFTHQGADWTGDQADEWLGTQWLNLASERNAIIEEFRPLQAFAAENNVPVHVGEFGAYSTADLTSRVLWTSFVARWFEEQNMSWAYWEFSAGFGIYDPQTQSYLEPLVNALLHDPMPEPVQESATILYQSNFEADTDGWWLNAQNQTAATLLRNDAGIVINIDAIGDEAWHIQLVKPEIPLLKGHIYRLSIEASAAGTRNIGFYAGKASDPWNAYSEISNIALSEEASTSTQTFMMNDEDDAAARLVVDLGQSTNNVNIFSVTVEEISIDDADDEEEDIITSVGLIKSQDLIAYPNPFQHTLYLKGAAAFQKATLYDLMGRKLEVFPLSSETQEMDFSKQPKGQYILLLEGAGESYRILLVKE